MLKGFRDFILRGNVIDLAIAVVIGASFSSIVSALTADIITPLIGAFGGVPDFSAIRLTVNGSEFLIGHFINALISFLISAAVIYFLVVIPMTKFLNRIKKTEEKTSRDCPECLSDIPKEARKCKFCGSTVGKAK